MHISEFVMFDKFEAVGAMEHDRLVLQYSDVPPEMTDPEVAFKPFKPGLMSGEIVLPFSIKCAIELNFQPLAMPLRRIS